MLDHTEKFWISQPSPTCWSACHYRSSSDVGVPGSAASARGTFGRTTGPVPSPVVSISYVRVSPLTCVRNLGNNSDKDVNDHADGILLDALCSFEPALHSPLDTRRFSSRLVVSLFHVAGLRKSDARRPAYQHCRLLPVRSAPRHDSRRGKFHRLGSSTEALSRFWPQFAGGKWNAAQLNVN